jgi:hypothetical protein
MNNACQVIVASNAVQAVNVRHVALRHVAALDFRSSAIDRDNPASRILEHHAHRVSDQSRSASDQHASISHSSGSSKLPS